MKKTSILIPAILVICLIALALLVSQAIASSEQGQTGAEDSTFRSELPNALTQDSGSIRDSQADNLTDENAQTQRFQDLVPATAADEDVTANGSRPREFLVIAGTFRQQINARTRVRNLRDAGFDDTAMELFDRGTYAVALVNRSTAYTAARDVADRVREAGFEVKVYRKR